jgi:lipase chaperone LimK
MGNRHLFLLGAICLAAGIGAIGWMLNQQATDLATASALPSETRQADPAAALRTNQAIQNQPIQALPELPPLPRSLQGSSPDVQLQTDADGNLLLKADILHLFEFYLSALVEEPLETSLTRISLALAEQLQGPALAQARDLLKRYLEFKIALAELHDLPAAMDANGHYALAALTQRQQRLQALRQQHFSAEENLVFFQEQDSYDNFMLQQLQLSQDQSLDAGQRQQAIEQLEQQLPEPIRQARAQATRQTQLYERTEQMKQDGASAAALFKVRAEVLGDEAATALAALDQRQAQWNQRLASYQQERAAIRESGLSAQDQQAALASLIEQRFEPSERMQVQALE